MLRSTKPTIVYAASIPYSVHLFIFVVPLFKLLYNSLFIVNRLLCKGLLSLLKSTQLLYLTLFTFFFFSIPLFKYLYNSLV